MLVAACATAPAPDPTVDLAGTWRITAVNGVATPSRMSGFTFRYAPPHAYARFDCNDGSGPARVERGWLVVRDFIVTTALCHEDRMRFSHGYDLFGEPLAIEQRAAGVIVLRNARGSITLKRAG